jgi:hypothetical protein
MRYDSDCLPEHLVQQLENISSVFFGQTKPAALIVEDIARGAALQRSGEPVVEVLDDRVNRIW